MNVLHEEDDFQGLYVRASSHQRYSHCDSEILFCPQIPDQFVGIACGIGNLLAEVFRDIPIPKAVFEYILHAFNDFSGMMIVLGEDQGLRNVFPLGLPVRV